MNSEYKDSEAEIISLEDYKKRRIENLKKRHRIAVVKAIKEKKEKENE